jgi:3-oxoadipate enol-lactonase
MATSNQLKKCIIVAGIAVMAWSAIAKTEKTVPPTTQSQETMLYYDSAKIHYEVRGQGEPLLLIHGGFLDLSMWDSQIDDLVKAGYQVIRYSDIGHGKTQQGNKEIVGCAIAKKLLDTLKVKKVTIVGLSWGAMEAMDFALTYPERMNRLVLVSPGLNGAKRGIDSLVTKNTEEMFKAVQRGDTLMVAEEFMRSWAYGPRRDKSLVNEDVRNKIKAIILKNLHRHWGGQWATLQNPPAIERLAEIKSPTLLVLGEHDVLDINKNVEIISGKIPNSKIYNMKGVAHMLPMEKPVEFNTLLIKYLKTGDVTSTSK